MQKPKKLILGAAIAACFASNPYWLATSHAAELNTQLPKSDEDIVLSQKITINLPAQPLAASLKALSGKIGLNITYNDKLVTDKQAPALSGTMRSKEALQKLLTNTGLEAKLNDQTLYIQRIPTNSQDKNVELDKVEVRAKRFYEMGPLPGLGLTKEEIPGNVQSISAKEIKEAHSLSLTDLMNRKLQSVTVNDYQGNPFQMDVQYRGFTAGPQIGTPQGLSVFLDGVRMNEPFGDVVNWDMMPMNAFASVDVFPGSNPIFGLNTLGGAFSLKTKDGFNNTGVDADILTGSFGRKQLQVEGGWNNGTIGLFAAGNFFLEDGWRENSPSKVNQLFTKASYRGDKLDLNFSTLLVANNLTGNGLLPSEMYAQDRNSVFSSPDTTKNTLQQFQLSGSYFVDDHFTVTGQVYRRKSDRRQKGGDVMRDYSQELTAKRRSDSTDQYTCLFPTTNDLNLPDYVVVPVVYTQMDPANLDAEFQATQIYQDYSNGVLDIANYSQYKNTELPSEVIAAYRYAFEENRNFGERNVWNRGVPAPPYVGQNNPDFFNEPTFRTSFDSPFKAGLLFNQGGVIFSEANTFFTKDPLTGDVIKNYVMAYAPINQADCAQTQGVLFDLYDPVTGNPLLVDGIGLDQPGYIEGTPTAILTDNQIEQIVDGLSLQLNWNLEKHKFMVGASMDSASADYSNYQQLGFLDANRKAYLDPEQAHPQFAGAYVPLANNNFDGTNVTKSIYFSETWTPIETLHFTAAGRYNQTKTKNKIAARSGFLNYGIGDLIAEPDLYNVCPDTDGSGTVTTSDCAGIPLNYRPLRLTRVLDPEETEKFSYYSFNPSLGVSWQAKESLNIYANIAKGTRTPSVIELGCALDKTPVGPFYTDGNGNQYQQPKSVAENRQCTLPTTLSGDPYLPQIRATTYDIGMRGMLSESLQWNLGAYQTDLKDDIYYVAVGGGQGFFDSIGDTRRRGIETGISGKKDKWGFALNYALTEATFENTFYMYAEDNSSAKNIAPLGPGVIQVNKGNRMPGSALHNINATLSYEVTPEWRVSLNAVMHSDSYVRGNENNEHKQGVQRVVPTAQGTRLLAPTRNPGTVPGYAVFNFQTSYKLNKEWTATMLVNNLFDQEYYTAGRLGRNPFSPSVLGAIGPDGYNHNSGDWMSTNFIAPGAPRGVWFSLNWHFVPD